MKKKTILLEYEKENYSFGICIRKLFLWTMNKETILMDYEPRQKLLMLFLDSNSL